MHSFTIASTIESMSTATTTGSALDPHVAADGARVAGDEGDARGRVAGR
jgi:hypothetical protein